MEISDAELRERLLAFGYAAPPITGTSKAILVKKLHSLESNTPFVTASASEDESAADGLPTIRQRPAKIDFRPRNVGAYSRCAARSGDLWDRLGWLGTALLLLLATGAVFCAFKFIGDWSDRRYRSVHLVDGRFPKCSQGGQPRVTCVPDAEFAFVESNLNLVRATLHHATLTERCAGRTGGDFVGAYPLFGDDRLRALLAAELGFAAAECDTLLRNSKVLFAANPQLDVKVLADGLLYRNARLLRSCGFAAWNTVAYTYALYALTAFAVVWFVYKFNRWASKLRARGDDRKRRLVRDVVDVLRQYEAAAGRRSLPVDEVRRWIDDEVVVDEQLWSQVQALLQQGRHESGLRVESKLVQGRERLVFCLEN